MNIFWPRKRHNKLCKGSGLRCTCGDIFSMDESMFGGGGDASDNGGSTITQGGQNIVSGTAQTPQQTAQTQSTYPIETYLQQLMGAELGQPGVTAQGQTAEQQFQNQGPLSQNLYNQVSAQAADPTAGWQSTLATQLTQAQNQINEYYNSRGLDNSGIAISLLRISRSRGETVFVYNFIALQCENSLP